MINARSVTTDSKAADHPSIFIQRDAATERDDPAKIPAGASSRPGAIGGWVESGGLASQAIYCMSVSPNCAVSQLMCVGSPLPFQSMFAGKGHPLCVEPLISARRYT